MRTRQRGFSLIELLVTLVVMAILAGVALPSYRDNVRKSGRMAAKGTLLDISTRQEQHFLNNRSYSTSLSALGLPNTYFVDRAATLVTATDDQRAYRIALANATSTSYDIVATAVLDQAKDLCGNYKLTSTGVRSVTGAAGSRVCW